MFDLPATAPPIVVAAGGRNAARLAAELGDGLFATEADPDLVDAYRTAGGSGPTYAEVPVSWARDHDTAVQAALRTSRWAVTGWPVMSELPNPANFEAATATVRPEDIAASFACGPDASAVLEATRPYLEAGFDRIAFMNAGPDPDGFIDAFRDELGDRVRADAPAAERGRPTG
ncbi:G6PDH family F420-dependent oxidoreductase [Haloactinopolyspora alba]|uniref:G6PDH family F420-dependent oxidoreductase n=1 Tax=Haloactinopolyspora alba TaxID=648780 RepID=A0A2P8DT36_9ACTN|nr:G6PDH family F420-dependent oxidoreductase [Haloactinopolyspora alba]